MSRLAPALLAAAIAVGCASVVREGRSDRPIGDAEAVSLYVRWREAERQRDSAKLEGILWFASEEDRRALERRLEALRLERPGRVVAEPEVHLVDRPADGGAGDFLFLVPAGGRLYPERVRIVVVAGEPRIEYEPPVPSAADALRRWRGLQGEALEVEVERTRRHLAAQVRAVAYTRERNLPLAPLDPDPAAILASLEGLEAEAARARIVALLGGERNAP